MPSVYTRGPVYCVSVCQCAISVPQCILPVYVQYTLNTLEFDLGIYHLPHIPAMSYSKKLFNCFNTNLLLEIIITSSMIMFITTLFSCLSSFGPSYDKTCPKHPRPKLSVASVYWTYWTYTASVHWGTLMAHCSVYTN